MNDLKILKSLNVLYVDDDKDAREKLESILKYYFNNVYTAGDGYEAFEVYKKNTCNLLLVDYDMPIMNGNEFLKLVREENIKIPAVVISAYEEKDKLKNAIKLNLVNYLVKPYSLEDLKNVLNESIEWMQNNALLKVNFDDNSYYDFSLKSIVSNESIVQLTAYEATILEYLFQNENRLVSYDTLLYILKEQSNKKSLLTIVYKLKKKIPSNVIKNVKDLGYLLSL